jgi:hypothetical protein
MNGRKLDWDKENKRKSLQRKQQPEDTLQESEQQQWLARGERKRLSRTSTVKEGNVSGSGGEPGHSHLLDSINEQVNARKRAEVRKLKLIRDFEKQPRGRGK